LTELYDFYGRPELWFTGGRNDDANSGIKATFNYIRDLLIVANGGDTAIQNLTVEGAKTRLTKIFSRLGILDHLENLLKDSNENPVTKQELEEHTWIKVIEENTKHPLVKALMSNLVERFAKVMVAVLRLPEYTDVVEKLKGFVVHGGFIRALLSEKVHDLHSAFVSNLNQGLNTKFQDDQIQVHDPYLDGVYHFTLEDLAKQDAA